MFVVDATVLLAHPPHAVARVVRRLHALPRWCAGLRRVRPVAPEAVAPCVFIYVAADVRLTLRARTLARAAQALGGTAEHVAEHAAEGDGLALRWTFVAEPASAGLPGHGSADVHTRLRARTTVVVDPAHPLAAARATLCRLVARRAPADLERLGVLLARRRTRTEAPRPEPPRVARVASASDVHSAPPSAAC